MEGCCFSQSRRVNGGLIKTRNLSKDNGSLDRDMNPGPPEYKAGIPTTQPQYSTIIIIVKCVHIYDKCRHYCFKN
jgi:hypothetical protein